VDPLTGRSTDRPLRSTNEYIHPSVRTRFRLAGPGVLDKGVYEPRGLTDTYKLIVDPSTSPHQSTTDPQIYWRVRSRDSPAVTRLPEAPLWRLERELARRDPDTYDYIKRPPPTITKKRRSVRPMTADPGAPPMSSNGGGGGGAPSTMSRRRASTFSPRSTFGTDVGGGDERAGRRSTAGLQHEPRVRARSKSRARSVDWDRETEIRENMPHRKEKDKAWWEGRR
jgi:hypothetical protein